jgi:hypothetical protein
MVDLLTLFLIRAANFFWAMCQPLISSFPQQGDKTGLMR